MKAKSNFRTVVKHSYLSVGGTAKAKAKAHVNYVAFRPGKDKDHQSRLFFDAESDTIKPGEVKKRIESFRHKGVLIHKLILSPGEDSVDMKEFTRSVMKKLGQQKGGNLEYWAVVHDNTDHQHAHIIVAGKDKEGHRVRLHLKDADFVREAGDKIAEKLKETELIPEPQISAPSKLHQFFMKIGLRVKQAQSKDQNKEKGTVGNDQREISLIGEPVSNVQKQKRLESEAKRQKRKLAKHNTIITVHRTFVPDEYRARTPKEELLELKSEYDEGYLHDQVSRRERKILGEWIDNWEKWQKVSEKQDRSAGIKSHSVRRIEITEGAEANKTYSKESKLEELEKLKKQNDDGEVFISAAEERALNRWIAEKRRELPVLVPLKTGEKMTCLPSDDLEFLEKTARVSKDLLPETDYKRLWSWIFRKRLYRDINTPVALKSPLGKLVYSRSDELEPLQVIAEKFRTGEKWVVEQMNKNEYERICKWIKEKYEREPQIW